MSQALVARSLLFVPATRPDRFAKAAASGTDIVTVDLEDSVAPRDKEAARQNLATWLSAARTGRAARTVRINSTRSPHGLRDILAILEGPAHPDLIVVPKVEAAADLEQLAALLQSDSCPTPSAEEVEHARAVLAENEKGIGLIEGQMIDEAIARRARRVLALAEQLS